MAVANFTVAELRKLAESKGLIFQSQKEKIDGITYRYVVCENAERGSVEEPVTNLTEAYSVIQNWVIGENDQ